MYHLLVPQPVLAIAFYLLRARVLLPSQALSQQEAELSGADAVDAAAAEACAQEVAALEQRVASTARGSSRGAWGVLRVYGPSGNSESFLAHFSHCRMPSCFPEKQHDRVSAGRCRQQRPRGRASTRRRSWRCARAWPGARGSWEIPTTKTLQVRNVGIDIRTGLPLII